MKFQLKKILALALLIQANPTSAISQKEIPSKIEDLTKKSPNDKSNGLLPFKTPLLDSPNLKDSYKSIRNDEVFLKNLDELVGLLRKTGLQAEQEWFQAVSKGDSVRVLSLISQGVDINTLRNNGRTALMDAVEQNNTPFIKFLVSQGADVNVKSKERITALAIAVQKGNKEVIELLKKAGAK